MNHSELYRDDLLNRFPNHTFTETVVGSFIKVEFKVSDAIDSVSDSSGVARFNFSGPTLILGEQVTISGFTANTSYNGTFNITATDGTGYFEVSSILFGSSETGTFVALVFEATKLLAADAYRNIHHNLVGTFAEALPRITTTQKDALTDPDGGLQFLEITDDEVQVYSEGKFKTVGAGEWKTRPVKTVQTTDNIQTIIDSFTLDDEKTYMVQIHVVCTKSDGSDRGGFIKVATLYRDGGGAIIQDMVTTIHEASSNNSYDADITVSGNDVRASVTGFGTETINWKCSMQFIEQATQTPVR